MICVRVTSLRGYSYTRAIQTLSASALKSSVQGHSCAIYDRYPEPGKPRVVIETAWEFTFQFIRWYGGIVYYDMYVIYIYIYDYMIRRSDMYVCIYIYISCWQHTYLYNIHTYIYIYIIY